MQLGNLLDMSELNRLLTERYITRRDHPTLPIAILNYTNECMFQNYWPETVQHCRGLVIELTKSSGDIVPESNIIARPYHKFFGLDHPGQPDYQLENLPLVIPTVTEKVDGWFGIQWHIKVDGVDHYGVASRGSFDSPGAQFATQKLQKLVKYGAVEEFPKGYSPVYEIIFKAGKIVVDYPFEGLVLTGCVNIETGEELPYEALQEAWAKIAGYSADNRPWIRLVKAHRMTLTECLTANKQNFEGYVLTYPRPGTWPIKVKVKLEDYKRLHKLITGVTPQQIWKSLHDPAAVWYEGENIPDHFRKWAIQWRNELYQSFQRKLAKVMTNTSSAGLNLDTMGTDRNNVKEVMKALNVIDPNLAPLCMSLLKGHIYEVHQAIWDSIRPVGRGTEVFYREGQGE